MNVTAPPALTGPQLRALANAAMTPGERVRAGLELPRRDVRQRLAAHGYVTWEIRPERGRNADRWTNHVVGYTATEAGLVALAAHQNGAPAR